METYKTYEEVISLKGKKINSAAFKITKEQIYTVAFMNEYCIFRYENNVTKFGSSVIDPHRTRGAMIYRNNYGVSFDNNTEVFISLRRLREATKDEKDWLEECIRRGEKVSYIPFRPKNPLQEELSLMKEEIGL